jgi:hypothetical protein
MMTNKEEITKLKQELADQKAKVEALEAAQPKPQKSREERERETREWMDQMHQMREGRMSLATPPSVVRDVAVLDDALVRGIALRDARAPTSPSGTIPNSQQVGGSGVATSPTPGWSEPRPLTNPPGTNWVDAIAIADDVRQRSKDKR